MNKRHRTNVEIWNALCLHLSNFSHWRSRERLACPQQQDNGVGESMLCLELTSFFLLLFKKKIIATNYPNKKTKELTFWGIQWPIQKENLPKWYLHNEEPEQINAAAAVNLPRGEKKNPSFLQLLLFSQFSVPLNLGCVSHWMKQVLEETVWEGLKQTISRRWKTAWSAAAVRHTGSRMI